MEVLYEWRNPNTTWTYGDFEAGYRELYDYYRGLRGEHVRHGTTTMWDLHGHVLREEHW